MTHYVAIIEEEADRAIGVWFPDLPGCFSAGDTVDEAMTNARQAVSLWAEVLADRSRSMPAPRSLTELRRDPEIASDLAQYMVALVPYEEPALAAAE